ncbi:MAG: iron-sulfur cluster assembly accessory protein [Gammaproteobacteria bacterium]|nr:MAG: iron-sulfur cluster assembly accessory protein [Gammaproteobacteria bacterium]
MTIEVTENAQAQIVSAMKQSNAEGMALRIAAQRKEDGGLDYQMGFDDDLKDSDIQSKSGDVTIVVAEEDEELLRGTVLDYVEIEAGKFHFIFSNPNDPSHTPPEQR